MVSSNYFNPFNREIQKCLDEEFPKSLIHAIQIVCERFDIEPKDASKLLSPKFLKELESEYHLIDEHDDLI